MNNRFLAIIRRSCHAFIQATKHCEFALTMGNHRLVPCDPERATEPQITNGFQNAGFTTAIGTVDQVKGEKLMGSGARLRKFWV